MAQHSFNLFQRLIRCWEAVHPYNAAQVLRFAGAPSVRAINDAWECSLAAANLGRVCLGRHHFRYEVLRGETDRRPVRVLPAGASLARHLSEELNAPFEADSHFPFRPFLIPAAGSFELGVIYQHWIADSVSIRLLMREWCARLFDPGLAAPNPPRAAQTGYWDLFGPRRGGLRIDHSILNLFRSHMRFRTVRRVQAFSEDDFNVGVTLHDLPLGLVNAVRAAARSRGATVGDALQAALAVACHRNMPMQRRKNRRDIAIGNIVDLRKHADRDLSNAFGFYLGFTHVACRRQELHDFSRVLQSVSLQNRARRRDGVAQHTLAALIAANVAQRFSEPGAVYKMYRKEAPMAAGLSNVNLDGGWPGKLYPSPLLGYLRISPTGPIAPLVLSATTLGSRMRLASTYRTALLDEDKATAIVQNVIDELQAFAEKHLGPLSIDISPAPDNPTPNIQPEKTAHGQAISRAS